MMHYKIITINTFSTFLMTALLVSCGYMGDIKLKEDKDYVIDIENGRVVVTNYSDHSINIVKIVGAKCGERTKIKWEDQINYFAGSGIQRGWKKAVIGLGKYSCFYHWVGYER